MLRLPRKYVHHLERNVLILMCFGHTNAMELLQSGIDISLIDLWLGHESVETTQIYLDDNVLYLILFLIDADVYNKFHYSSANRVSR